MTMPWPAHDDLEWHETADMPVLFWTCCDRYGGPFYIVYPVGFRYVDELAKGEGGNEQESF
jgi:hypothetical protein